MRSDSELEYRAVFTLTLNLNDIFASTVEHYGHAAKRSLSEFLMSISSMEEILFLAVSPYFIFQSGLTNTRRRCVLDTTS